MVEREIMNTLNDTLAVFFKSGGDGSYDTTIENLQGEVPDALRLIAEYLEKKEPQAKREISVFNECADYLASIEMPKPEEDYLERDERLEKLQKIMEESIE